MPLTAPVVESPAEIRRQARAELAADARADQAAAARAARATRTERRRPVPAAPASGYSPGLSTLAALVADLTRPSTPPAPRPAPAPQSSAPVPAPAPLAAPVALPAGNPYAIGPDTIRLLAAMGQRDYVSPVQPGDCPFWVVNSNRLCGLAAPYRVLLTPTAYLPACQGHAHSIRAQAAQHGVPFRAYPPLPN